MKIAIANVQAPFVRGGAEYLADSLALQLRRRGHQVDVVRIPFKWYPPQAVADHMLACRLLRLDAGEPDLLIALKFPAYLAPFENKRVWLLHQFRQAYDSPPASPGSSMDAAVGRAHPLGGDFLGLPEGPQARGLRDLVVRADDSCLRQARKLFTISRTVAARLKRFNGLDADGVLYPPVDRPELFRPGPFGDYFFYPSRLNEAKRQHLAIEAMRHLRSPFRLVLAGKPDSDEYGRRLREQVERCGLSDRVTFLGWVPEEEKARWMSNARAALCLPQDEDYGYVTLEAMLAKRPVITCADSGGPLELVRHDENGLVVPPTPEALAGAMESLCADAGRARDLGESAHQTPARHRIGWDCVVDRLTAA